MKHKKNICILEQTINILGLFLIFLFTSLHLTKDIFSLLPPTGDSLGLHFQTAYFLKNIGFPDFTLRLWNPGNFAGEPLLVHYFPLPFILIGIMGFFMDLELAYNIGTFLPIFLFPLSVYFCMKKRHVNSLTPLIVVGIILIFLYNENMSGGAFYTVRGRFVYAYALCFLFLGLGFLIQGLKVNKFSFGASCFFSATALSHAYIFIIVPLFFLSSLVFAKDKKQVFCWLKILTCTGICTLLLSLWFLWPMVSTHQWTTPFAIDTGTVYRLIGPFISYPIFYLLYVILFICFFIIADLLVKRSHLKPYLSNSKYLFLWILPSLIYLGLFFIFPRIGLISYQAVYSVLLFLIIPFSILYVFLLKDFFSKTIALLLSFLNILLHTFYPFFGLIFISCFFIFCGFLIKKELFSFLKIWRHLFFWILPSLVCGGLFFVFPKIGLVDYRAIPPIFLFLSISLGVLYAFLLEIYFPKKKVSSLFALLTVICCILWAFFHIDHLPRQIKWNYSGWHSKENYKDLQKLTSHFKPGLSKPRILAEYAYLINKDATGNHRVFGMLPFFASRSHLIGLYVNSNLLSPASNYLQDKISQSPECHFQFYLCPEHNINTLDAKLQLMGVGSLVLVTQKSKEKISKASYLLEDGIYGPWTLYKMRTTPHLAEPLYGSAQIIEKTRGWRHRMNEWFDQYNGNPQWQLIRLNADVGNFKQSIESNHRKDCDINVIADFFGFDLETDCLHIPHIIKFAYHSSWRNSANDPIYLISPGMIGIVPSQNKIRFDFGQTFSWKIAAYISILTLLLGLLKTVSNTFRVSFISRRLSKDDA